MRKDNEEIPQIRPSILDPPQIRPAEEIPASEDAPRASGGQVHRVEVSSKKPTRKGLKFSLPGLSFRVKKSPRRLLAVLGVVALLTTFFVVIPAVSVVQSALALSQSANALQSSLDSQDIAVVKAELANFRRQFEGLRSSYARLGWVRLVPIAGTYYKDGQTALLAAANALDAGDIFVAVIEPYADIIGFGGSDAAGGSSANDRIEFLINTIDDILPHADAISKKAQLVNEELKKIDPNRYPEKFLGKEVRASLAKYLARAGEVSSFVANSKPLLEAAPYLLGVDGTRTYLVLFQNDKELRPTGGFITAYSIVQVTNGKVQPVRSNDIYNLDGKYKPSVEAPDTIKEYLKGPYLISDNYRLRDMNWSPDFKTAMELFVPEAKSAGIENIDGVIAVDTHVVVNILNAIGPVDVPGYGQYSTNHDERCDCPQVIYELESFADVEGPIVWSENEPGKIVFAPPNYLNRKEIVGPLTNAILTNALGQPKEKLPVLFEAGWRSLTEKHILLYMFDERAQAGAEAFGIAGRVSDYDGDYLHIVDANLAGRKSNLYVTQEVSQKVEIAGDGTVVKTVNITYQNPQDYDGWLNSVLPNWTRVYIPKGSEVVDVQGFEKQGEVYEELDKTVISGGFELRPKGIKKITLVYKLPFKVKNKYNLMLQKQAGTDAPLHSITVGGKSEEFYLRTDKVLSFDI